MHYAKVSWDAEKGQYNVVNSWPDHPKSLNEYMAASDRALLYVWAIE